MKKNISKFKKKVMTKKVQKTLKGGQNYWYIGGQV